MLAALAARGYGATLAQATVLLGQSVAERAGLSVHLMAAVGAAQRRNFASWPEDFAGQRLPQTQQQQLSLARRYVAGSAARWLEGKARAAPRHHASCGSRLACSLATCQLDFFPHTLASAAPEPQPEEASGFDLQPVAGLDAQLAAVEDEEAGLHAEKAALNEEINLALLQQEEECEAEGEAYRRKARRIEQEAEGAQWEAEEAEAQLWAAREKTARAAVDTKRPRH